MTVGTGPPEDCQGAGGLEPRQGLPEVTQSLLGSRPHPGPHPHNAGVAWPCHALGPHHGPVCELYGYVYKDLGHMSLDVPMAGAARDPGLLSVWG